MSKISIIISNMNGKKSELKVRTTDTISKGKSLYNNGNPQWKLNGEVLKDEKTFDYYEIEDGDIIISNDRTRGGKKIENNNIIYII